MYLHTGKAPCQQVYNCMVQRTESIFRWCDSLWNESQTRSPKRSHAPFFERQWPGVSAALADGNGSSRWQPTLRSPMEQRRETGSTHSHGEAEPPCS
jgi:hypothetical protein